MPARGVQDQHAAGPESSRRPSRLCAISDTSAALPGSGRTYSDTPSAVAAANARTWRPTPCPWAQPLGTRAEIDAPLLEVWAVVQDVISVPEWVGSLDKMTPLACDAEGRPTLVETEIIKVRPRIKSRVRIRYDGPTRLSSRRRKAT
jgi:hypothetical protein